MSQKVRERINKDFQPEAGVKVKRLLSQYVREDRFPDVETVQMAILELAKGNVGDVAHYVRMARYDYRDVLYFLLDTKR